MDPILITLDKALKDKGLSDAAASQLAVGHTALIKKMRMPAKGEKRYNVTALQKLAQVLDLELYFGPPRETGTVYTTQIDHEDFAAIPRVDARLAAGAGAENGHVSLQGALAFRRDWLRERGISPAQACLLTVAGDSMAPTLHHGDLVMIDERRTQVRNRHVYAFVDTDGSSRVKRLDFIENEMIILTSDNPAHPAETRRGPDMNHLRILGEIVWSAHEW